MADHLRIAIPIETTLGGQQQGVFLPACPFGGHDTILEFVAWTCSLQLSEPRPMAGLTRKTALVVIPPAESWPPIQAIREKYDRKNRRWMPHITLVYPFLPREQFDSVRRFLADACGEPPALESQLAEFSTFRHRRDNYTVWLRPEPEEPLVKLQAALCQSMQEAGGSGTSKPFQPHLSVGQVTGRAKMVALVAQLQAAWSPLRIRFAVRTAAGRAGEGGPNHDRGNGTRRCVSGVEGDTSPTVIDSRGIRETDCLSTCAGDRRTRKTATGEEAAMAPQNA